MLRVTPRASGSYGTGSKQGDITEFCKRAKSIYWRKHQRNPGKLVEWDEKLTELRKTLTKKQAVVQAAKDYSDLYQLFSEYDVSDYNPTPHNTNIEQGAGVRDSVACKDIEQSHLENLRWAIEAAGGFLMRRVHPKECPNNSAWWLYRQALEEPKDFLAKYNQAELKSEDDYEKQRRDRNEAKWSIAEINEMLKALGGEKNEQVNR